MASTQKISELFLPLGATRFPLPRSFARTRETSDERRHLRPRRDSCARAAVRLQLEHSFRWHCDDVWNGSTGWLLGVVFLMGKGLELDLLFPIKDTASASLMLVKAKCLLDAKVIGPAEAALVSRRAHAMLRSFDCGQAA